MTEPDIEARLRNWHEKKFYECIRDMRLAANEIERLRAERDEARRDLCMLIVRGNAGYGFEGSMRDVANERGWDCFKENSDA